ncbi:MAG: hypothetical protein A2359_00055 [Candidatus Moranbacteria bacterium RIFOXYB1_FULL_43_19]|nr:MAG: hypothetical protein A2359_00055 [Candidatus Moranbacteria bacterium RIFOXYB1_FULL_43_19]OGI34113.1 MAG: hypothetical protein A2420_04775 [Candidatus Moranbacteria bacterium RIFOXYC1_FULL_44_13]OGI37598.1 MAG: hypothetical protein A2612_04535 [Candidatus Moranbacteria bacterium RIFOXYD1_FULL_44_12]
MMNIIFRIIALAALLLSGIAGCAGIDGNGFISPIFDPISYVGSYAPRQVDWNRAPLSVTRNTARLDLQLQEAQRDYDAARNAVREDARAAARYDFEHGLPRGAHAPPILYGEAREAYSQEWYSRDQEYRNKLEQGARNLGQLDYYRSRQPRPR